MMSDSDSDNTIDLTPIKDLIIQSGVATSEGTDHKIMAVFLAAGVEKIEDLKYLEEKDLETVLPLVKRKKMISHIQMVLEGTSVPLMEHDDSINTSRSSSSSLIEESDEDVMKNKDAAIAAYTFPHQQIPVKMKKWLGTKRPTPAEKAHFVRIVTDDIMVYNCRPSRDNLRPIAKKLVTMFPSSLQTIGVCGAPSLADDTAHYSLLRQMEQRVVNQRRSSDSLSKESQGKRKHDHGCKQFHPASDKTSEELEEIRLDMVTMYQEQQPLDNDEVFDKMSDVFSYLRGVINSGKNGISDLKRDWPLLFTFCGLSSHYDMLVDGSTIETFKGNYLGRMAELACYMQSLQSKNAGIQKVCMQVAEAKQATRSNQPEVFGLLLMIIKYFKEDESCMFRKVRFNFHISIIWLLRQCGLLYTSG